MGSGKSLRDQANQKQYQAYGNRDQAYGDRDQAYGKWDQAYGQMDQANRKFVKLVFLLQQPGIFVQI